MSDKEDIVPAEAGFWCGLEFGRLGENPLPPNPYYLRTDDRLQWSRGYLVGYRLGGSQRNDALRLAHMIHHYPDGGADFKKE